MPKKTLHNLTTEMGRDKFYGNAGYVKELIVNELKKMRRNAFFAKGLQHYSVDEKKRKIVFFENDANYTALQRERRSSYTDGITKEDLYPDSFPKENEKEKLDLIFSTQAKDFKLTSSALSKVNHTENLIHLWLYQGLEKYDHDGSKMDIVGYDYLEHGYDPSLFIELDDLKFFLIDRKYPLPVAFFEEEYPNTEKFLSSLKDGDLVKPFSMKALNEFMANEASAYFGKEEKQKNQYNFYIDGAQWYIAYEDQHVIIEQKNRRGMIAIHYLLQKYMEFKNIGFEEYNQCTTTGTYLFESVLEKGIYYKHITSGSFEDFIKKSIIEEVKNGWMHYEQPLPAYSQMEIDSLEKQRKGLIQCVDNAKKKENKTTSKKLQNDLSEITKHRSKKINKNGKAIFTSKEKECRRNVKKNIRDIFNHLVKLQKNWNDSGEDKKINKIIDHLKTHIKWDNDFYYKPPEESSIEWQLDPPGH